MTSDDAIAIADTKGPLFLLDMGHHKDGNVEELWKKHFPQCYKKWHGWALSIEEVDYLLHQPNSEIRVELVEGSPAEKLYENMRKDNVLSISLYKTLSQERYALRSGSQFGALFIGYTLVQSSAIPEALRRRQLKHGEVLFYLGPLSELEKVRAARVAASVGKEAHVCSPQRKDGDNISWELEVLQVRKRKRQRSP
ncbi:hypothetical protein AGDE_05185 [Angomonas deanei]|uniref:tRNA intron endonuclease, catalytic C-terminal domain containing protein, putative n=1 Tax=Angomonas deanei TaxID=59799 RepID=A0A7G2C058_9TRYP|nr:hypothetical protein AGDE_05185 [Angomonas deanei]CAD2212905.1 tRNA intron endonuclease, catalytic C-terminal domain containing protein, putative [Angomonas deanei]|eukprot:EPY38744.1 hypothetical protein AGDE_05185 [Angomonas deanei]